MTDELGLPEDELEVEHSGYEQVPSALYLDPEITDGELRLWIVLSDRGGRKSAAVPNRKTLARMMRGVSVRTVDARMTGLQEKGWLLKLPRFRENAPGMTSSRYTLLKRRLSGPEDPRAIRHQAAVEAFNEEMAARIRTNQEAEAERRSRTLPSPPAGGVQKTARGQGGAESCTPPRAEDCAPSSQPVAQGGVQKTAHQEPNFSFDPDLFDTHSDPSLRSGSAPPAETVHGGGATSSPEPEAAPVAPEDLDRDERVPVELAGAVGAAIVKDYLAWYRTEARTDRIPDEKTVVMALRQSFVKPALEARYTRNEIAKALAAAAQRTTGSVLPSKQLWRECLLVAGGGRDIRVPDARRRTAPANEHRNTPGRQAITKARMAAGWNASIDQSPGARPAGGAQ